MPQRTGVTQGDRLGITLWDMISYCLALAVALRPQCPSHVVQAVVDPVERPAEPVALVVLEEVTDRRHAVTHTTYDTNA